MRRFLRAGLRLIFNLLYTRLSWSYDFVADIVSLGLWKSWILAALPMIEGPCVLELGHGPGHALLALAKTGHQVFGLDCSFQMSKRAKLRLEGVGFAGLCVNGYAQSIPFPDASFNSILATFPTDYILDPRVLSEIRRTLKSPGSLIILPIAWLDPSGLLRRLFAWLFRKTGQIEGRDSGYAKLLENAGFMVTIIPVNLASSTALILLATKSD